MRYRHIMAGFALAVGLLAHVTPAFATGAPNPEVLPTQAHAYGHTYGEWSAAWWRWAFASPKTISPIADTTGEDCAVGQSGHVWFLAGTAGGTVARTCTIPSGRAVLVPLLNGECSTVEGTPLSDLGACARNQLIGAVVNASVDGKPLQTPGQYLVESPVFDVSIVADNAFGLPSGTGQSMAVGYFILLHPLSTGRHTLAFSGSVDGFSEGATYDLTISGNQ